MILRDDQLREVVALLRQQIDPEAIYLFGSQTTEKASHLKGDVDLCIVVPDKAEPYRETVKAYQSLQEMPFPKDIIVRQKKRFEERASWPASIEYDVKQSGRLLYSA